MKAIVSLIMTVILLLVSTTLFLTDNLLKLIFFGILLTVVMSVLVGYALIRGFARKHDELLHAKLEKYHYPIMAAIILLMSYTIHGLITTYNSYDMLKLSLGSSPYY